MIDGNVELSSRLDPAMAERQQRLSYKFQRLRERLREAIETGVLSGKLPGERVLARQFRVNAKTLSKALTDLAAEGLLERTIGRGTFVRGQTEAEEKSLGKWLLVVQPGRENHPLIRAIEAHNADIQPISDPAQVRPSVLTGCTAVVDLHGGIPESTLRDLMLRSLRVVLVDTLPKNFSTNAVLIDRPLGAQRLARTMLMEGRNHIAVIEHSTGEHATGETGQAVRQLVAGSFPEARVDSVSPDQAVAAYQKGATGFVCETFDLASAVHEKLLAARIDVPRQAVVGGVGIELANGSKPVSGYVVSPEIMADTLRQIITEGQVHKPTPVWLTGSFVDHHTMKSTAPAAKPLATRV